MTQKYKRKLLLEALENVIVSILFKIVSVFGLPKFSSIQTQAIKLAVLTEIFDQNDTAYKVYNVKNKFLFSFIFKKIIYSV